MTPIADMLERMLIANEPPAAIIAAVRALETVTLVTRDMALRSRVVVLEQARIRQQTFRKKQKEQKLAKEAQANDGADRNAIVTRDSVTAEPSRSVVLSSLLPSLVGKPLKKSKTERVRARGTRMEPGTPLSSEHRAIILAEGILDPDKFWAEFVDYWSEVPGQRGVKIGWTGTLRNRCRDVISKGFNRPSGQKNGRRTVHDAARDLHEGLINSLNEPPPGDVCLAEGENPIRLLPPR